MSCVIFSTVNRSATDLLQARPPGRGTVWDRHRNARNWPASASTIAGRDERHVDAADDLGNAADIGGDQRHLRRGRLEHDIGKGLRARRHHHAAAAGKGAARRLRPGERDPAVEAEPARQPLQTASSGPLPTISARPGNTA